jgi:hypothetical protein
MVLCLRIKTPLPFFNTIRCLLSLSSTERELYLFKAQGGRDRKMKFFICKIKKYFTVLNLGARFVVFCVPSAF